MAVGSWHWSRPCLAEGGVGCEGRITGGSEIAGTMWWCPAEGLSGEYVGSRLGWSRAAFNS